MVNRPTPSRMKPCVLPSTRLTYRPTIAPAVLMSRAARAGIGGINGHEGCICRPDPKEFISLLSKCHGRQAEQSADQAHEHDRHSFARSDRTCLPVSVAPPWSLAAGSAFRVPELSCAVASAESH